jgi:AcrR family transcriptional regulator
LSREEIVAVAMRLTEKLGLEKLTMRAVADEFGVTPMALYYWIPNKNVLLQLLADAVIGEVELPHPDIGPWDIRLAELARGMRARLNAFPGVGAYLLGSDVVTPGADRLYTRAIQMLVEAGFDPRDATLAFTALHNLLLGRLIVETALRGPKRQRLEQEWQGRQTPPHVVLPADDFFEYGLEALLIGLRARLVEHSKARTP